MILNTGELRALPPSDAPTLSECTRLRDRGDARTAAVGSELLEVDARASCALPRLPPSDAPALSECTRFGDRGDVSTSWVASELAAAGTCARPALLHSLSVTAGGTAGPGGTPPV